jgi:integrase
MMRGKITKRLVDAMRPGPRDLYVWDQTLSGFGLKITPKGKKVYVVQYRMGGRGFTLRRYTIGPHGVYTPEEARERARKVRQTVCDGIDPMLLKKQERLNTIEKLIQGFIQSRRRKGRRSADEIQRVLEREIGKTWRGRSVASITKPDIHHVLDAIMDRGSSVIANRTLAHLKTMFNWAKSRGIIMNSPADNIEKPGEEVSRERTPDDSEITEIWRATAKLDWPFEPALKLLILTGQRREEVGQMRWSELKLSEGVWTLPAARTKNGQPHDIHLSPLAVQVIETIAPIEDCDLVFSTNGQTPISGWSKAKRRLDEEIEAARRTRARARGDDADKVMPMPEWRIHDLRRSVATGLSNLGVAPVVTDRILNHVPKKQKGQVMFVYNRAGYLKERREAMVLWGGHIERVIGSAHRPESRVPESARAAMLTPATTQNAIE